MVVRVALGGISRRAGGQEQSLHPLQLGERVLRPGAQLAAVCS